MQKLPTICRHRDNFSEEGNLSPMENLHPNQSKSYITPDIMQEVKPNDLCWRWVKGSSSQDLPKRLQFMYETATNPFQNLCCNEHLTPAF